MYIRLGLHSFLYFTWLRHSSENLYTFESCYPALAARIRVNVKSAQPLTNLKNHLRVCLDLWIHVKYSNFIWWPAVPLSQEVTKRWRLSLLTNSAFVYESQMRVIGGGGEVACLSQWVQLCTSQINFGDLPPYLTYALKVHKIENFFDSDFGICFISLLVMSKY